VFYFGAKKLPQCKDRVTRLLAFCFENITKLLPY